MAKKKKAKNYGWFAPGSSGFIGVSESGPVAEKKAGPQAVIKKSKGITSDEEHLQYIVKFVRYCIKNLGIKSKFVIKLAPSRQKAKLKTLAQFDMQNNNITVLASSNRLLIDMLRSIAHELVHLRQKETGDIRKKGNKDVGGEIEDEANAVAGQIVKKFSYENEGVLPQ